MFLWGLVVSSVVCWVSMASFGAEGHRGSSSERLAVAFPMSDRVKASWPKDGPTTGQGQAHQQSRRCLWGNRVRKGTVNPLQLKKKQEGEYVRETALKTPRTVKKKKDVLQALELRFSCTPQCRPR